MLELDMDIKSTLECGQIFRFQREGNGYWVCAGDRRAYCEQRGNKTCVQTIDETFFYSFFDGETNYAKIQDALSQDPYIKQIIQQYPGLRILNQELWETTVSFIISQNNRIPRIQNIIENLCRTYGEEKKDYFAFPTAKRLAALQTTDLSCLKCGYRDSYLLDAAQKFSSQLVQKQMLECLSLEEARQVLFQIKGVGPKVADCILLFGAARRDAFPIDTWMKKIISQIYKIENIKPEQAQDFAKKRFGKYSGYAQQYLFYAARQGFIFE